MSATASPRASISAYKLCKSLPLVNSRRPEYIRPLPLAAHNARSLIMKGDQPVLRDVTFAVQAGEVACILGASGCGKSTLLRILAGLWKPDSDQVDSKPVVEITPPDRNLIGWLPQRSSLIESKVAWKNVAIGALARGASAHNARRLASKYLTLVDLADWDKAYPHELSGGMQQRLTLARTLAAEPHVLLLDEPLSSLDIVLRQRIAERLRDYAIRHSAAVLITTHTIEESIDFSNRVLVLSGAPGRIAASVSLDSKDLVQRHSSQADAICSTRAEMVARVYTALGATAEEMEESKR